MTCTDPMRALSRLRESAGNRPAPELAAITNTSNIPLIAIIRAAMAHAPGVSDTMAGSDTADAAKSVRSVPHTAL
jgi:hypothetical protein